MASFLSKLETFDSKNFTKKENEIIKYIKENMKEVTTMNIEILAQRVNTGYSAIYGLLRKVQIKGYRDFIIAIVAEQERLETNNLNLDATDNIFLYYQDILQRNNQIFHSDKLLETVTLLKKAKAIYLVGVGNTGLAVKELANRLFSFGFACSNLVEDENNTIMRASLMQPDDLLICMSLEGKTQAVVAAAKEAKNNGANVVAVTSKYNSDLSKYADVNHIVVSSSLYEKSEIFISVLLPLIYWNDNLIQVLLSMDKDRQYLENKVKSNKILKKYR
ncbi:MAG: MurR/RpiR family transcriptional regulator [Spiroplasma poulsonii]|uniref:HTH-type transcriptional regulator MurR n=1 Tax=Spiroplasma poulsonii TaxID=2138 RepID=A0A2P6FBL7_9MOLU|nr:MurR/RpiR family transcriptional regulator [Spiroplasma poulsonii]KAF0851180.1 HTH-type transcriptional regulator MurR [Spiroplasma poulsonii]MBW1241492.1 MurR/RpiR family transcriptional regulator [Spiroplasma poulsonii]PQM30774.1 HTH-type transcriptional regulator MurR [Spiroplasma poulsonii]PWF95761.1 HTH-type transcriptional regulator MurR [Spiroplasma poulsonii]PWF98540.1 HTH-type transcriptional regulator MurR [Spiroplasma poulsonii]